MPDELLHETNSATHTPGPWTARVKRTGESWWVVAPRPNGQEGYLAECVGRQEANEANARLIAAAPDLLAALRVLLGTSECSCEGDCVPDCTHVIARAAIAKAEGR